MSWVLQFWVINSVKHWVHYRFFSCFYSFYYFSGFQVLFWVDNTPSTNIIQLLISLPVQCSMVTYVTVGEETMSPFWVVHSGSVSTRCYGNDCCYFARIMRKSHKQLCLVQKEKHNWNIVGPLTPVVKYWSCITFSGSVKQLKNNEHSHFFFCVSEH